MEQIYKKKDGLIYTIIKESNKNTLNKIEVDLSEKNGTLHLQRIMILLSII